MKQRVKDGINKKIFTTPVTKNQNPQLSFTGKLQNFREYIKRNK